MASVYHWWLIAEWCTHTVYLNDQMFVISLLHYLWINIPHHFIAPSSGQLRLVQGNYTTSNLTSGRLEIYLNGQWGTVCDDLWGQDEANVACQQLGYTSAAGYGRSIDEGLVLVWMLLHVYIYIYCTYKTTSFETTTECLCCLSV